MSINTQVTFDLPIASSTQLGGVAVQSSSGLLVDSSGDLSVDNTQFLSVSQAASTYATQSSVINTLSSFVPTDKVTIIDLTVPSTYMATLVANNNAHSGYGYPAYSADVILDNSSTVFIINNPVYAYEVQVNQSIWNTYYVYPTIATLTLPSSVSDGHTFKITYTSPNNFVQGVNLTPGGTLITKTGEGLLTFNQTNYANSPEPNSSNYTLIPTTTEVTFKIPGTYTYSSSLSSWVQVA